MKLKRCACIEPLYSELPFYDRFQAAADDGFEFVEFWGWTDKDLDKVREAAEKAGVGIAGFNGDGDNIPWSMVNPAHKEPFLDFLRKSVEAAKKVGAGSLTIHSNALGDGGIVVDHFDELSDTIKYCAMFDVLKECAKIAEENDIQMNLEALNITTDHVGNFLKYTQQAAEMTRLIGSPKLKVLYDVYHMQINEGCIGDTVRNYADQFGHIHVADAPGRHEPGTGEINYAYVFRTLEENGYEGLIGYELFPKTTTAEAVKAIMAVG